MAKHKYNDFDDSQLREHIMVDEDFPRKQELVGYLHSKGYFNETVAEKLAYVFLDKGHQLRYDEIATQMDAVISLMQFHKNHLCVKASYGNDVSLGEGSTQIFIKGIRKHVLGLLGRGQSENYEYLTQFAYRNPAPGDEDGIVSFSQKLSLMGAALIERYGVEFEYYGDIEQERFECAVQDTYDNLCRQRDLKYPWRGFVLPLVSPYDDELCALCAKAFDENSNDRKHMGLLGRAIKVFCGLNARNSCLFRMIEDYKLHTYHKAEGTLIAKRIKRPAASPEEQRQIKRLESGLLPEGAKQVEKLLPHLSYQYIYYVLSGNILAPDGYIPHAVAETVYDLYHIVMGEDPHKNGLTAKQKHKNIIRSFEIDPATGLYKKGL